MSSEVEFISVSVELDRAGLIWAPAIGDEITDRKTQEKISILVDPLGLTPGQLRGSYIWLPTVEQLVEQFEARQALIYHAGVNDVLAYETVIRTESGLIETAAMSLRLAFGQALQELLTGGEIAHLH